MRIHDLTTARRSGKFHDDVVQSKRITFSNTNLGDDPGPLGAERNLHLHGFDYA
jgi:hypothetical protein